MEYTYSRLFLWNRDKKGEVLRKFRSPARSWYCEKFFMEVFVSKNPNWACTWQFVSIVNDKLWIEIWFIFQEYWWLSISFLLGHEFKISFRQWSKHQLDDGRRKLIKANNVIARVQALLICFKVSSPIENSIPIYQWKSCSANSLVDVKELKLNLVEKSFKASCEVLASNQSFIAWALSIAMWIDTLIDNDLLDKLEYE